METVKSNTFVCFVSHTQAHFSTYVLFLQSHTMVIHFRERSQPTIGWFNYKLLVLCVQTLCCRWDFLRRRSRNPWWARGTMMWWLHTCCWTIGTLRYTASHYYTPSFYVQLMICDHLKLLMCVFLIHAYYELFFFFLLSWKKVASSPGQEVM